MSKFLSHWFILLFLIWLIGYVFNIKQITDNVNPYYTNMLLVIGYIFVYLYNTRKRDYKYEPSYLFFEVSIHILPWMISYYVVKNKFKNDYAKYNLLIVVLIYLQYIWGSRRGLRHLNKERIEPRNPINIYLRDKHPTSWKEMKEMCQGKGGLCRVVDVIV